MVSKHRQKTPTTKPKTKLKTMNDISAADAVKLFHAAMSLNQGDPMSLYAPISEGFPKDVAAKDFMDSLAVYRQWWSDGEASAAAVAAGEMEIPWEDDEQIGEVANIAANIPEKRLEELVTQLSPPQRKVFDRIVDGSHPHLKDFINDETLISDETGKQMAPGTIRVHVSAICRIFGVANRKILITQVRPLLPPKAEKRDPK